MTKPKSDLLTRIAKALRDRQVPVGLAIEWDQHGVDAWTKCRDATELLRVLGYLDHKAMVRAVCVCARTVLPYVPADELRPLCAIEMAEAWTRDEASAGRCFQAAEAASEVYQRYMFGDVAGLSARSKHAVAYASAASAAVAHASNPFGISIHARDVVNFTIDAVAYAEPYQSTPYLRRKLRDSQRRKLANLVRSMASCPDLRALVSKKSS